MLSTIPGFYPLDASRPHSCDSHKCLHIARYPLRIGGWDSKICPPSLLQVRTTAVMKLTFFLKSLFVSLWFIQVSTRNLICPFNKEMFIACLLGARHCSKHWRYSRNESLRFLEVALRGERWTMPFKICNISEGADRLVVDALSDKRTCQQGLEIKQENEPQERKRPEQRSKPLEGLYLTLPFCLHV